ncbi:MAG: hypothetical protein ACLTCB_07395 [Merdibacter sp.]
MPISVRTLSGFAQLETLMHKRDLPIHALLNEVYALNDYYACRTLRERPTSTCSINRR